MWDTRHGKRRLCPSLVRSPAAISMATGPVLSRGSGPVCFCQSRKWSRAGFTCLSPSGPHLDFLEEVSTLQPIVDKLKTLGVNKIIALGHSGIAVDRLIARKVRGVDVVIGGHTNTFLYTGRLRTPVTEAQAANQRAGLQAANQRAVFLRRPAV